MLTIRHSSASVANKMIEVLEAIQNNAIDMAVVNRLHKQLTEETVVCMFGVWDIDDVRECNPKQRIKRASEQHNETL